MAVNRTKLAEVATADFMRASRRIASVAPELKKAEDAAVRAETRKEVATEKLEKYTADRDSAVEMLTILGVAIPEYVPADGPEDEDSEEDDNSTEQTEDVYQEDTDDVLV